MRIPSKGLRALSWPFALGFVTLWIAMNLLAAKLNGGSRVYHDPRAQLVVFLACELTAALALGIVLFPPFRRLVTSEQRAHYYEPLPYLFIALLTGFLGVTVLLP